MLEKISVSNKYIHQRILEKSITKISK